MNYNAVAKLMQDILVVACLWFWIVEGSSLAFYIISSLVAFAFIAVVVSLLIKTDDYTIFREDEDIVLTERVSLKWHGYILQGAMFVYVWALQTILNHVYKKILGKGK